MTTAAKKKQPSVTQLTIKPRIGNKILILNVPMQKAIAKVIRQSNALEHIADDKQFGDADVLVGEIHMLDKDLEANRKAAKAPVLAIGKQIDAACKPFSLMLKEAKSRIATHVAAYREEKEAEAALLRAKELEEQRDREKKEAAPAEDFPECDDDTQPEPAPAPVVPKSANVKMVTKRKVIIDPEKLPKTFTSTVVEAGTVHTLLVPDTVLINQLAYQGEKIPGVTIETTQAAQVK